jgi:hypothetical protein
MGDARRSAWQPIDPECVGPTAEAQTERIRHRQDREARQRSSLPLGFPLRQSSQQRQQQRQPQHDQSSRLALVCYDCVKIKHRSKPRHSGCRPLYSEDRDEDGINIVWLVGGQEVRERSPDPSSTVARAVHRYLWPRLATSTCQPFGRQVSTGLQALPFPWHGASRRAKASPRRKHRQRFPFRLRSGCRD